MRLDDAANASIAEKPSNKHYERDMKHKVKYPRFFMRVLGLWPLILKDSSFKQKCFSPFLIIICVMALFFIIVPPSIDLITRKKDPTSWITAFNAIVFHSTSFIKYFLFVFRYKTIRLCMEHMKIDWKRIENERDRVIMLESVKFGHSMTVVVCTFTWSTGFCYNVIMPHMSEKTINEHNETVRPLAYSGFDIFVDTQSQPTYEIIFFAVCLSAIVSHNAMTASCSFTAAFVSHACGQMRVIVSKLENLVDGTDEKPDRIQERLSIIARYHIRVLSLSSKIEESVRELCFVEVVSSTMIICSVEYHLVMEWSNSKAAGVLTYVLGFVANSLNILLFCHIGEFLKEQGHKIGKAVYAIEWYRLSNKTVHDLMMIIIMDNYPPKITAGRVFELSIASFGTIIRTSLTYCNMLRTLTS